MITMGIDTPERMLVVAHTPRGEAVRITSARKASPGETEKYHT